MIRVLHLTPHLGGGVGKALSGLVATAARSRPGVEHAVLCLEPLEKSQFAERIVDAGCRLETAPSRQYLEEAVATADIVQLEFWNHPAIPGALCGGPLSPLRLLVWCHISGLHTPRIPPRMLTAASRFVFTSPCSWLVPEVASLAPEAAGHLDAISSGGLDDLPWPDREPERELRAGYLGSLNFTKLHPEFVSFLAAIRQPDFRLRLIGDETNKTCLLEQCRRIGRPDLLDFRGYTQNVAGELQEFDVMIYLLNPEHYGTAENALLEAMAMGVVPIVLDNPAERMIVEHGITGLVVRTRDELADAFDWLANHPEERQAMARRAAAATRERYTYGRMESALNAHYTAMMAEAPWNIPFREIFGATPADWFLAFQRNSALFSNNDRILLPSGNSPDATLLERTKGSVFHFLDNYPDDPRLIAWSSQLEPYLA